MIDRNNTINYLIYLLNEQKKEYKKENLEITEKMALSCKMNLLEDIIYSIKQMPDAVPIIKKIDKKNILEFDEKTKKIIQQYDTRGNLINEFRNLNDASEKTNVKKSGIINNVSNRQSHAGGFIWKYRIKGD